jgi:hypothetical protein
MKAKMRVQRYRKMVQPSHKKAHLYQQIAISISLIFYVQGPAGALAAAGGLNAEIA